ncbi:hypothetical protein RvY_10309 [Ramazzottius varieornatus]|uniref:Uncharacterized protein n=1 Tax=Ramazzottius varieornatus TaxID=947166 RepID=A0A1D1VK37_RAMVA|nr:hypothetical protein RvY_10309 [Ramazzottius varieornatus]
MNHTEGKVQFSMKTTSREGNAYQAAHCSSVERCIKKLKIGSKTPLTSGGTRPWSDVRPDHSRVALTILRANGEDWDDGLAD